MERKSGRIRWKAHQLELGGVRIRKNRVDRVSCGISCSEYYSWALSPKIVAFYKKNIIQSILLICYRWGCTDLQKKAKHQLLGEFFFILSLLKCIGQIAGYCLIVQLWLKFTLRSGINEIFFTFSICISLIDCEKVNLPPGSVEQLFIWRHNGSAVFQSPWQERDSSVFANLLFGHAP